jgi:hypothetical protein
MAQGVCEVLRSAALVGGRRPKQMARARSKPKTTRVTDANPSSRLAQFFKLLPGSAFAILLYLLSNTPDAIASNVNAWANWINAHISDWFGFKFISTPKLDLFAAFRNHEMLLWVGAIAILANVFIVLAEPVWRFLTGKSQSGGAAEPKSVEQTADRAIVRIGDAKPDATIRWAHGWLVSAAKVGSDGDRLIWDELRQAARSGEIMVWGRPISTAIWPDEYRKPIEIVPQEHWRNYDFDVFHCLMHPDDADCGTVPDGNRDRDNRGRYVDLRVNKGQVKTKWREAAGQ